MKVNNITIGADPELFIVDKDNNVISAVGIIPGQKGDPYRSKDMPLGFGLESDNILAEFNIPPVTNKESFINSIEYMKTYIDKFVKNINPDLGIECSASRFVNESQLQSPQAKEFGCEIDYNVYTHNPNPKPKGKSTNLRSGGFHIHFGYKNPDIDTSLLIVRYLDMYLGIPSVIKDADTQRRSLYGKAGSFRLKSYGLEYRVLSSAMMKDRETLNFVWTQLEKAIHAIRYGDYMMDSNIVQNIINNSDVEAAKQVIKEYQLV